MTKYEVLTPNGWSNFDGIRRTKKNGLVKIYTNIGVLKCSLDHKVKTDKGFKEAAYLHESDTIITKYGRVSIGKLVFDYSWTGYLYDLLDVKKENVYYTNDFVSHNCEFLGSSGTLISGATLKRLKDMVPLVDRNNIKMYEEPVKGEGKHSYVLVADVSRGKGLDYSAFSIFDVTKMPYRQVCTFRDNMVTPIDYAEIIYRFATHYNEATVLVEINDIGGQVSDALYQDYEYENILMTESAGRVGKRISTGFKKDSSVDRGIRTTKQVKSIGCSTLKLLVEQDQLIVNDFKTVEELSTFSKKGLSYEAEPGNTDDLVMGLVLFSWLTTQQFFKDFTDINTLEHLREKSREEMDEDMLLFGFHNDGREETSEGWVEVPNYGIHDLW